MSEAIQIKITNLPQIKAAFRKAPQLMTVQLNLAIAKTLLRIKRHELLNYQAYPIRVITGGLIGSIQRGTFQKSLYGEVGPNVSGSPGVNYATYVEGGTYKMRPRPFLHTAVLETETDTQQDFVQAVDNVLNQIGRAT